MEPGKAEPRGNSQCRGEHCSHVPQPRHTGGQAGSTRLSLKPRGEKSKQCSGNKINYQDNKHSDFRGESDQGLQEPQMYIPERPQLMSKADSPPPRLWAIMNCVYTLIPVIYKLLPTPCTLPLSRGAQKAPNRHQASSTLRCWLHPFVDQCLSTPVAYILHTPLKWGLSLTPVTKHNTHITQVLEILNTISGSYCDIS